MYFYNKHNISKNDINEVVSALKSSTITKGKYLNLFENKLKRYFNSKYALVFTNATMALFSISKCLQWSKNDYIILSPITFVAGANAVLNEDSNPVFVDIDKYSNLDPILTENKIIELKKKKKKVKAIIVTDYGGNPANWKEFYKLKRKYNILLINDNCHALGSSIDNYKNYAVKYADIVVQSFHAVKNITTAEGGALMFNKKSLNEKFKSIREHGFLTNKKNPWSYEINFVGYNARLSELNCALGVSQMKRLNFFVKKRNKIAQYYNKKFAKVDNLKIPEIPKNNFCSYHLYPLRFDWKKIGISKSKFYIILKERYGINLQIHYKPIYKFKHLKSKVKVKLSEFKNTEKFYKEVFSIPLYVGLKLKNLNYISNSIIKTLKRKA